MEISICVGRVGAYYFLRIFIKVDQSENFDQ